MTDTELEKAAAAAELEAEMREAKDRLARSDSTSHANHRFLLALLGVLPWIGVLISASVSRWAEQEQDSANSVFRAWLEEHQTRLAQLETAVGKIVAQARASGPDAEARLNSDDYLPLVRQGFRVWDKSDTEDKRELVRKILTNAACDKLCTDDFVRRFIEWIDHYNELHLRVVKDLFTNPRSTRAELWERLSERHAREDSAEADLFKLLIRDLSTGQVIRQSRETDSEGNFYRKRPTKSRGSKLTKSAFDDSDEYVLTDLGEKFVHYALNEVVRKLPARAGSDDGG